MSLTSMKRNSIPAGLSFRRYVKLAADLTLARAYNQATATAVPCRNRGCAVGLSRSLESGKVQRDYFKHFRTVDASVLVCVAGMEFRLSRQVGTA